MYKGMVIHNLPLLLPRESRNAMSRREAGLLLAIHTGVIFYDHQKTSIRDVRMRIYLPGRASLAL